MIWKLITIKRQIEHTKTTLKKEEILNHQQCRMLKVVYKILTEKRIRMDIAIKYQNTKIHPWQMR